jgi:hypothetical protein
VRRGELSWTWRWGRLVPERCEECGRRDPLWTLVVLVPRFHRMEPASGLSVVLRWQLWWGPLCVQGFVPEGERAARLKAHLEASR